MDLKNQLDTRKDLATMKRSTLALAGLLALGLTVPAGFAGEGPMLTHDWPAYTGPDGTFTVPDQTPILSELKKAKLLWVNEQEDLGYAKTVSSDRGWIPGTRPWPSGSGSLIVAGGLVIAGYFRPIDNFSPTNRATNTNAVAKIAGNAPSRIEAKEDDPFAASGRKSSAAGDGDEEVSAGKGVAPQVAFAADDIVVAVDAATGKTRWKQVYAGKGLNRGAGKHPIYGAVPVASGGPSSPSVTPWQGKVFHLGTAGLVYAVDLATGKPAWEADVGQFRQDLLAILKRTEGKPDAERVAEVGKWWPYAMRGQLQVVDGVLVVPFGPWAAKEKHNPPKTPEEKAARKLATLFAFDAATGKPLWNLADGVRDGNTACAVKLDGATYALTVGGSGMLRLIAPQTGKVLWEEFLGVSHGMQPVVADGRVFVMAAKEPKPGAFESDIFPTAYALSATGAKRVWQSAAPFDGGMYWPGLAHRAGVLYAGLKGGVYALEAATGKELGCLSGVPWLFHLWGDRLVIPGDVAHESMGFPCTYTAVTPGVKDLKLAGEPFAFRNVPGYSGVCGYEVQMIHPFVDGYLFTRAMDVKKGMGVIMCWDLRQPKEN